MTRPLVLCVVGMHRSGTSVVAGILSHLGLYLGPEERMMPPAPDNPRGFFEYQPLVELNDEILEALGGTWDRPPSAGSGWERSRRVSPFRRRARALLRRDFRNQPRWGWKDPRASLTLPLWRRVLPPMRYVICVRNPVDVARSLEQRNQIPFERGVALWTLYVMAALRHSAGEPRLFISFESLVDDWRGEARRLAAFAELPASRLEEAESRIAAFVGGELRHHATPEAEVLADERLPGWVRALYILQRVAAVPSAEEGLLAQRALDALSRA